MAIEGFWSYVHADDDAEGGRISQLARDVVAQYELLTGESITLFLDRDNLEWGDEWKAKVDGSLASIAFFIPVLTPRYFLSAECRRELNSFIRKSQALGLTELLMPILYVDFPAMHVDPPPDDLIGLVKPFQWEDWTELRFADLSSAHYRRAVADLAGRLVRANAAAEAQPPPAAPVSEEDAAGGDDEPGNLELLQSTVEGLDTWSSTLQSLTAEVQRVGEIMSLRSDEINNTPTTPKNEIAVRLRILKNTAIDLESPVSEIERLSQVFAQNLYDVDPGVRYAIEQVPIEVAGGTLELRDACEFFGTIREFASTAEDALGSTEQMVSTITPVENLSRDIRPVLRTLRRSLTRMVEGREVIRTWVGLMDSAGLDCGEASA